MNCIIIDDESTARLIITQLCSSIPKLNIVGEFSNAIEAIKYLNADEVDLIFLDIHMPDFTGFDFIQTLKNKGIEICRRTPELVDNISIDKIWKNFNPKLIKTRSTYKLEILDF